MKDEDLERMGITDESSKALNDLASKRSNEMFTYHKAAYACYMGFIEGYRAASKEEDIAEAFTTEKLSKVHLLLSEDYKAGFKEGVEKYLKAASKDEVSWDEAYKKWHSAPDYDSISFPDWVWENYKLTPKTK